MPQPLPSLELMAAGLRWPGRQSAARPRAVPSQRRAKPRGRASLGGASTSSCGFVSIEEDLSYRAEALLSVFGSHRISVAEANWIGRTADRPADQAAIANFLYGGAWGREHLGNAEAGDGWRFRGGGLI